MITKSPKYFFVHLLYCAVCFSAYRCLLDARITGSDSKFMARTAENKLQFQLEAFRFQGAESGLVCICKTNLMFSALHQMEQNYI